MMFMIGLRFTTATAIVHCIRCVVGVIWAKILCRLLLLQDEDHFGSSLQSFPCFFGRPEPEWPWIIGFRRSLSSQDRAPKMQLFVLSISLDSFFVTLPSISSETCAMSLLVIRGLGTFVFCAMVLLGCSSWFSFLRAALLSQRCHFPRERSNSDEDLIISSQGNRLDEVVYRIVGENKSVTGYYHQYWVSYYGAFISLFYTFSLAGNINVYTPSQVTNRGK